MPDSVNSAMERMMASFTRETVMKILVEHVRPAISSAEKIHGRLTADPVRAGLIMVEEIGEAAADILTYTSPRDVSVNVRELHRLKAINELSQVAAMAILMIENLKEGQ